MYWKIILNQTTGAVELYRDDVVLARREWAEARNTSQEVLSALTVIKKEQDIEWAQVTEFKLDLDLPSHSTARRIAETFQNTYTTFVA